MKNLLTHEKPSPENPELHRHVNDPAVFVQAAKLWHLFWSKHSFTSKENENIVLWQSGT